MSKKFKLEMMDTILNELKQDDEDFPILDIEKLWITQKDKNYRRTLAYRFEVKSDAGNFVFHPEIAKSTITEYAVIKILCQSIPDFKKEIKNSKTLTFSGNQNFNQPDFITDNNTYEITSCGMNYFFKNGGELNMYSFVLFKACDETLKFEDNHRETLINIFANFYKDGVQNKMSKAYVNQNLNLVLYHSPPPRYINFNGIASVYIYLKNNLNDLKNYLSKIKSIYFLTTIKIRGKIFIKYSLLSKYKYKCNVVVHISKNSLPRYDEKYEEWHKRIKDNLFIKKLEVKK